MMKKPRSNSWTSPEPARWSVYKIGKKLVWLGAVEARDQEEALKKAVEELEIKPADRWRVNVQRE